MILTTVRTVDGFAVLNDDGTATLLDITRTPTGQTRPHTATEAELAEALTAETVDQANTANETTIGQRLEQRLVDLQAIIDRPQTVLADNTVAAVRTAIRDLQGEVKTLARVDRLQTRKLLRLLNGTD